VRGEWLTCRIREFGSSLPPEGNDPRVTEREKEESYILLEGERLIIRRELDGKPGRVGSSHSQKGRGEIKDMFLPVQLAAGEVELQVYDFQIHTGIFNSMERATPRSRKNLVSRHKKGGGER